MGKMSHHLWMMLSWSWTQIAFLYVFLPFFFFFCRVTETAECRCSEVEVLEGFRSDKQLVWTKMTSIEKQISHDNLLWGFTSSHLEDCSVSLFLSEITLIDICVLLLLLQYRAWWKDRYGNSSLNDQEQVEALLSQKSKCNSSSSSGTISTSITPALATRGTWKGQTSPASLVLPPLKQSRILGFYLDQWTH